MRKLVFAVVTAAALLFVVTDGFDAGAAPGATTAGAIAAAKVKLPVETVGCRYRDQCPTGTRRFCSGMPVHCRCVPC